MKTSKKAKAKKALAERELYAYSVKNLPVETTEDDIRIKKFQPLKNVFDISKFVFNVSKHIDEKTNRDYLVLTTVGYFYIGTVLFKSVVKNSFIDYDETTFEVREHECGEGKTPELYYTPTEVAKEIGRLYAIAKFVFGQAKIRAEEGVDLYILADRLNQRREARKTDVLKADVIGNGYLRKLSKIPAEIVQPLRVEQNKRPLSDGETGTSSIGRSGSDSSKYVTEDNISEDNIQVTNTECP